jgi:N6-L-threonylcarbamoyladenine synthase
MMAAASERGIEMSVPEPILCTDNAAMIAWVGYGYFKRERFAPMDVNPAARMVLGG